MKSKLMVRGTLAGVFVIMLSLVLIISALPVQAIPQPGHHFYGDVIGAAPGAVISARINGTEYATTTVDAKGSYGYNPPFVVPSDDTGTRRVKEGGAKGDIVEFYILGELAGKASFAVWGLTYLDLSLREVTLTVTSGGNGSTDPSGTNSYPYDTVVDITATADTGYEFDYWVVNSVLSGNANPISITMNGDYNVVANFAPINTDTGSDNSSSDNSSGDGNDNGDGNDSGDGDNSGSDNSSSDNSSDLPSLEGSLVAIVFIPGSQADIGAVLAGLNTYFDEDIQSYYLYFPGDSSGGNGYWEPVP